MADNPPASEPAGADARVPPPKREPPYDYIVRALKAGKVIPFLGAGASLGGRRLDAKWSAPSADFLPSASELAGYLDRLSGFPSSEPEDLTRVAQYFDVVTGRAGLDETLREIFAKVYLPGSVHQYLAELTNILIVTTNYDTLLEQAFDRKPHHVVVYNAGAPNLLLWEHGADTPRVLTGQESSFPGFGEIPIIFKMHGAADPRNAARDSFVITEDDYLEFLSRMQSQRAIPLMFAEHFRRSHFLFLGYGLKDWNLRVILHKIWQDRAHAAAEGDPDSATKPRASWAIQQRVQALEQEFWSRRGLSIYEMTVEEFVQNLRQRRE